MLKRLSLTTTVSVIVFYCTLYADNNKALGDLYKSANAIETIKGDYVFKDQIDLRGGSYTFPDCERIIFIDGAFVRNGKVYLNPNTYEIVGPIGIFEHSELSPTSLKGNNKVSLRELNVRWFGCYGQGDKDETLALEYALNSAHNLSIPLKIPRGTYYTSKALDLKEGDILMGEFAGQVGANNQQGQTIIRNTSSTGDILTVSGNHVEIRNIMLVCSKDYVVNGIHIKGGGLGFNMRNVFIGNTHYAVYAVLENGKGFSECKWEDVVIRNAVRGISIDMNKDKGQYLTFNSFYNTRFLNIKEYGVYFHSQTINTQTFRDCLFANVGYGQAYDKSFVSSPVYALFIDNDGHQGSVYVDGGYFENVFFSKDGRSARTDDANTAVLYLKNINCTVSNARFANTRTIVDSQGNDYVRLVNCIDNGYIEGSLPKAFLCRKGKNAVIDVNGYSFSNRDKGFIRGIDDIKSDPKASISRIQLSNHRYVDAIE